MRRRRHVRSFLDSIARHCARVFSNSIGPQSQLDLAVLEDRVLFSAVPMGDLPQDTADIQHIQAIDTLIDSLIDAEFAPTNNIDTHSLESRNNPEHELVDSAAVSANLIPPLEHHRDDPSDEFLDAQSPHERNEIIFIDAHVDDCESFIHNIQEQAEGGTHFDVVFLEDDQSGVAQISAELERHHKLDAIHLLSHGDASRLQLGTDWLTTRNLGDHAPGKRFALRPAHHDGLLLRPRQDARGQPHAAEVAWGLPTPGVQRLLRY